MNIGDHVAVSFISENRTEFSGIHFTGNGIIDHIEDNRVFGRLYSGLPFMCNPADVSVNVDIQNLDKYFKLLLDLKLVSHEEIQLIQNKSSEDHRLLNMSEFGLYIFAYFKSMNDVLAQKVADLEFKLLQKDLT